MLYYNLFHCLLIFHPLSFCRPPEHNTFYTSIDSMPEIKPRRKSIPFVSDLVGTHCSTMPLDVAFMSQAKISVIFTVVINFVVTD